MIRWRVPSAREDDMANGKNQNVGTGKCSACQVETHTTLGKRHRKCKKEPRGTWQAPPEDEDKK